MMTREELIELVAEKLQEVHYQADTTLINFFDDEVDWNAIAQVAVEVVLKEVN